MEYFWLYRPYILPRRPDPFQYFGFFAKQTACLAQPFADAFSAGNNRDDRISGSLQAQHRHLEMEGEEGLRRGKGKKEKGKSTFAV